MTCLSVAVGLSCLSAIVKLLEVVRNTASDATLTWHFELVSVPSE